MIEPTPGFRPLRKGAALVLAGSALFFLAACVWFDGHELAAGQRIEGPGSYALGMMFLFFVCPLLVAVVIGVTLVFCLSRNDRPWIGMTTAFAAIVILAVALGGAVSGTKFRHLLLVFPAPLLGQLFGKQGWLMGKLGWYVGIVIQFGAAWWLVVWGRHGQSVKPPIMKNPNGTAQD